ncbi:26S proteasome non-ATPase regulatory subunit 12 homolog A-like protein, partial [Tanacetum coccineum]
DHMGAKDFCLMGLREEMGGASLNEGECRLKWWMVLLLAATVMARRREMWLHLRPKVLTLVYCYIEMMDTEGLTSFETHIYEFYNSSWLLNLRLNELKSTEEKRVSDHGEAATVLITHDEPLQKEKNLFTSCVDVSLTTKGVEEVVEVGDRLSNIPIGMIYTSAVIHAQMTTMLAMTQKHRRKAVTAMVQQAMQYIDQTPNIETKIELIKTLNSVSAGKIFVEIDRARLIKRLAKINEEQGQIAEAADLMQEIAVHIRNIRADNATLKGTPLDVCGMAPSYGKRMAGAFT